MKSRCQLFCLILCTLCICSCVHDTLPQGSADTHVGRALQKYIDSGELPHAISILCDDGVEEVTCIGWADVDAKRPITLDDPYMQCSQTKGFCGVTVAILVEEGRLSLDDPVAKYLPEFGTLWVETAADGETRTLTKAKNTLTVRMCLNHTGGFPFEIPAKQYNIPGGGWTGGMPIRSVAATAAAQPLLFEPGTKELYSNTGIDIAAAVVETVTGQKWEAFLQEKVLDPLGMTETRFKPTDAQLARQVELYEIHEGQPARRLEANGWEQRPYNDDHVFPSAGAGLWTTARDQIKFYKMLMNLGVGDNGARILQEQTVRELLATTSRPAGMNTYSLGLTIGGEWFGHSGAWGTNCMVNPTRKRLNLWVVQINGPSPWNDDRVKAENAFFEEAHKPEE